MPAIPVAVRSFALAALLAVAACVAPQPAAIPQGGVAIGPAAPLSYGKIISMRPVITQATATGGGGLAGQRDIRGNILGAVDNGVVGGTGRAVENSRAQGQAFEFIIREDNAADPISVVQSGAGDFHPGERVVLTRGERTSFVHPGA